MLKSIAVCDLETSHGLDCSRNSFIHSGQEYGRTKQFLDPAYKTHVAEDKVPNKSHLLRDKDGKPFDYLYLSMTLTTLVMQSTSLIGPKLQMVKLILKMSRAVTI